MTISDEARNRPWRQRLRWLSTPSGLLAGMLVLAGSFHLAPARLTDPLRDAWMTLLRPAEAITDEAVQSSRDRLAWLNAAMADGERVAEAERQVRELTERT